MELSKKEINYLVEEIALELKARRDGSGNNLISRCPHCGKENKFGVYIGKDTERKKLFMSNCFSCGHSTDSLERLLSVINRPDLVLTPTVSLNAPLDTAILFPLEEEEQIDDSLCRVDLPDFYNRCFTHPYLKGRGFVFDDYEYFAVGTTGKLNYRFRDYVIFPVMDSGEIVGYVARHIYSKEEIDAYNRKAKIRGEYQIRRFQNSMENEFVKLLYNYDAVQEDVTDTVILVEGIFDVVALTRKMELYDNPRIQAVATFGKKISQIQIYKLQAKGVRTVVIGYDPDAVETIKKTVSMLTPYFEVYIADIPDSRKDWEDLTAKEIYHIFCNRLMTAIEYKINKIQEL